MKTAWKLVAAILIVLGAMVVTTSKAEGIQDGYVYQRAFRVQPEDYRLYIQRDRDSNDATNYITVSKALFDSARVGDYYSSKCGCIPGQAP